MYTFAVDLAQQLPQNVRFGGSSWTYPGWRGSVYQREYRSDREFKAHSLEEYATFPLFRTVGIDSFFYAPPSPATLTRYAAQVPHGFVWVSKVWERITIPRYPQHSRYGKYAGQENEGFLDAALFEEQVLERFRPEQVRSHTGPFVFQFGTIPSEVMSANEFIERLGAFLKQLPSEFRYAVEVRNPEFLTPAYFHALNNAGATHCFNHWHFMPALRHQMKRAALAGGLTAPFFVARLLTPLGVSYARAVQMHTPYDRIKTPQPDMRLDVVRLLRRAVAREAETFILANNRVEGNSPMTIDGIVRLYFDLPAEELPHEDSSDTGSPSEG